MSHCEANWCTNNLRHKGGSTFHAFPFSRPHILREWINNVQRENWLPKKRSVLCSDHFEEKCFDRTGQTVRLRPDAVPTRFKVSSYLQKNLNHQKALEVKVAAAAAIVEKALVKGARISTVKGETKSEVNENVVSPEVLIADTSPLAQNFVTLDHRYCKSPNTLRRKLYAELVANSKLKKKLKTSVKSNRRLKKAHSLIMEEISQSSVQVIGKTLSEALFELFSETKDSA